MDPITDEILELMPDIVVVHRFLGTDGFGDEVYDEANPENIPGRVVGKVMTVTGKDGLEHVSMVQFTAGGAFNLTSFDRYTLPVRFSSDPLKDPSNTAAALNARRPEPLAAIISGDENGPHHETIFF